MAPLLRTTQFVLVAAACLLGGRGVRAQCVTPADPPGYHPATVDAYGSVNVHIRCSDVSLGGSGAAAVTRSAPSQPAPVALTTTAAAVIPAGTYLSVRYVVQGANGAGNTGGCATWGTTPPSFSGAACANGFPIFAGSVETRIAARDGVMPSTPLLAIGPPGGSLSISYEVQ